MNFICNPGTQPIAEDHSESQASANMEQFLQDVGIGRSVKMTHPLNGKDGRYCFQILHNKAAVTVWMPGCAIEKLTSGDFDNYRLEVNGSSWLWGIGVGITRGNLENPPWIDEPLVDRRQSYLLQAGYLPSGTTAHCCGALIEETWSHPLIEGSAHSFSHEYGSKYVSDPDDDNL